MAGLVEPDQLQRTFARRSTQVLQACAQFARQKAGLPFRVEQVEGGQAGVSWQVAASAQRAAARRQEIAQAKGIEDRRACARCTCTMIHYSLLTWMTLYAV